MVCVRGHFVLGHCDSCNKGHHEAGSSGLVDVIDNTFTTLLSGK